MTVSARVSLPFPSPMSSPTEEASQYAWKRSHLVAVALTFVVFGMLATLLGPLTLELANLCNVPPGDLGNTYLVGLIGIPLGPVAGGLLDRYPKQSHMMLVGSQLLQAAFAATLIPAATWEGLLAVVALFFSVQPSYAVLNTVGNSITIWAWEKDSSGALNVVNTAFGLGALAAPLMAHACGLAAFSIAAVLSAAVAVPFMLLPPPRAPRSASDDNENGADASPKPQAEEAVLGAVLPALVLIGCAVGLEVGLGGWVYTYTVQGLHLSKLTGTKLNSLYWGSFTIARVIISGLAFRFSPLLLLSVATPVLVLGLTILSFGNSLTTTFVGVALAGIGIAAFFANAIGLLQKYSVVTGRIQGFISGSAGAGASAVPAFIGWCASGSHLGGLSSMPKILLALSVLMTACLVCTVVLGERALNRPGLRDLDRPMLAS